jgi:hypothetical protein
MGSPFIFAGNFAKALKSNLNLADQVYVLTGSLDPTVTPVDAPKASLYMRNTGTAAIWQKTDNGSSTNWNLITTNTITGLNAALIADGTVSNAEFQYINSLTSNAQDQLTANATAISNHLADTVDAHDASAISNIPAGNLAATDVQGALNELQSDVDGRQLADSDLTALAGLSSAGIIARTGAGTAAVRTLTSGSSKLSLTNGDGVSGNPTFDVSESNLTLDNIGGTLGYAKGGTGLTALGSANQLLRVNAGATALEYASVGSGDVVGPASATDNAIARFDGTTGKLVQNSDCSISDTGAVTLGPASPGTITHVANSSQGAIFAANMVHATNESRIEIRRSGTTKWSLASPASDNFQLYSGSATALDVTSAGAVTLGPNSNYAAGDSARAIRVNQSSINFRYPDADSVFHSIGITSDYALTLTSAWTSTASTKVFKVLTTGLEVASATQAGAWTLGASGGSQNHVVHGGLAIRGVTGSLSGTYNGLDVTGKSMLTFTGTSSNLNGFANGVDGQIVVVFYGAGSGTMTISHNNGSATQKILVGTGANITLTGASGRISSATFMYSSANGNWITLAVCT